MENQITTPTTEAQPILGRPVNLNSARQQKIADMQARKENGTYKLGRPVVEGSKRQQREAELAAKREAGELKKGRPVNPNSKKQKAEAEKAYKIANGIEIKKGRPPMVKETKGAPEQIEVETINEQEQAD